MDRFALAAANLLVGNSEGAAALECALSGPTLTALVGCLVLPFAARSIEVDPLARTGQVSALAALQLRFALAGAVLLAVLLIMRRRSR